MKFPARSVAWLLPLFMTACIHRTNQAKNQPLAPPIEDAPLTKPDTAPVNLPPPVVTIPVPTTAPTTTQVPEKPLPKHKKSAPKSAPTPAQLATQQAANAEPEVPAIGDFTSGDAPDLRKQTENSIAEVERSLSGITRKMSDGEEKTSTQIKEFLKQAKTALGSGDADGAKTLMLKAKVLLSELTK
jgi:hypothetical protein